MTRKLSLPRSTPEAQGIAPGAISAFVRAADQELDTLHSMMLLRNGSVVAEGWWDPYQADDTHIMYSLSKSFTSSAIGLLVDEGRLTVDERVVDLFPDQTPAAAGENLKAMRVRHLLSMSTGHETEPLLKLADEPEMTWVDAFMSHPVEHEPGTHFLYNSLATYMLSAIVHKLTGGRMLDYLRPRLFAPLGIEHPTWEQSPEGIDTGGWGLSIKTEDIAAFGQMYLQKGEWQGRQLLSSAWVEEATSKQVENGTDPASDWAQGYGYQFWRCRHNGYRGDGAFGQYCVVLPDQQVVLAMTAGLFDMQQVLNLVWEHLLPAFGDEALPEDKAAGQALRAQLAALRCRTVKGQPASPLAANVAGRLYELEANEDNITAISFDFDAGRAIINLIGDGYEQQINCGYDEWPRGDMTLERTSWARLGGPDSGGNWKVAACGAWTDDQTFSVRLWWYETPFARDLTCTFADDTLLIDQRVNQSFGPLQRPTLTGRAVVTAS